MVNLSQNILTTGEQCSIRCVPPEPGAVIEAGDEIGKIVSLSKLKKYANRCEFPEKLYESLSINLYARKKAFVLNRIDSVMVFQGMTLFQVMEDFETWTPL
ncbi:MULTISPECIES: hypothetical protein [unclassified Microcoleus]|uniref:hypothetical protein n=1 Tax=unclassified Microcoleus TaxID=2642155 RepID=UPI001D436D2F|nr:MULTISPECIES: hypothetical protein [unclassified Microcoleus]MCC3592887.1 hypothetical protein [Microcoleus sp. PH2017_28_MFU_U_A]MCC3644964.1 hypothetical protein [Microcoleus sp. PH2017_33_LGB_O_A]TAE52710.1 MAG: hypothetical protein EAZ88_14345 [Oscillatoriales cyanobacterium]